MLNAAVKKPIIKKHVSAKHVKRPPEYYNDIIYEKTQSILYLQQYYNLRGEAYKNILGLKNYSGDADEYDKISDIVVARKGKRCIAGARITISTPENRILLPMEEESFRLKDVLGNLNLENASYGEYSRLAAEQKYTHECVLGLYKKLAQRSLELGLDYIFAVTPIQNARKARILHNKKMGLSGHILMDIDVPDKEIYEGIKMFLVMLDLTKLSRAKDLKNLVFMLN